MSDYNRVYCKYFIWRKRCDFFFFYDKSDIVSIVRKLWEKIYILLILINYLIVIKINCINPEYRHNCVLFIFQNRFMSIWELNAELNERYILNNSNRLIIFCSDFFVLWTLLCSVRVELWMVLWILYLLLTNKRYRT